MSSRRLDCQRKENICDECVCVCVSVAVKAKYGAPMNACALVSNINEKKTIQKRMQPRAATRRYSLVLVR